MEARIDVNNERGKMGEEICRGLFECKVTSDEET
jgi:hypothetical protein